jgi:hypothetical protein
MSGPKELNIVDNIQVLNMDVFRMVVEIVHS